jgi:hypothetical protein
MMSPEHLLRANGIVLPSYHPGRYYAPCPQCSSGRKRGHQKLKCLGITIDGDRVHFGCNHCGWTGPQKGVGNGGGPPRPEAVSYRYGPTLRKVRNPNWPTRQPKYFWQHLNGKGTWDKGTDGADTKSLLYRIDEVKQVIANGEIIAIVEGEKDADALWKVGIAATCNDHGASEPGKAPKWTKAHSAQLRGSDIVIFNDNDAAGYAHAEAIVARSTGIAKQIRRLDLKDEWPNIGNGNDVSDWLDKGGGTPDRLRELIEAAPVVTAPPKPREGYMESESKLANNVGNVLLALDQEPEITNAFGYDEMLRTEVLLRPLFGDDPNFEPRPVTDADVTAVQAHLQWLGFRKLGKDAPTTQLTNMRATTHSIRCAIISMA